MAEVELRHSYIGVLNGLDRIKRDISSTPTKKVADLQMHASTLITSLLKQNANMPSNKELKFFLKHPWMRKTVLQRLLIKLSEEPNPITKKAMFATALSPTTGLGSILYALNTPHTETTKSKLSKTDEIQSVEKFYRSTYGNSSQN